MQYQTSQQTRRLVGRLDQGEEILEAITALCRKERISAAEIRATGALRRVELVRFDAAERKYATLVQGEMSAEIVSLVGSVSTLGEELAIRLDGVLLGSGPFGAQVLAGQLRAGEVEALEFVIEEFVDVALSRSLNGATGRLLLNAAARSGAPAAAATPAAVEAPERPQPAPERAQPVVVNRAVSVSQSAFQARESVSTPAPTPRQTAPAPAVQAAPRPAPQPAVTPTPAPAPAQAPKPQPAQQMSWQEAAQEAQTVRPAAAAAGGPPAKAGEEPDFKAGDWLDHPTLGRCQIMRVEDDETVHVRMRGGKVGKLVLESFEIIYDGEEGGRNVFKLRKNRDRD